MDNETKYRYTAMSLGNGAWMVRRFDMNEEEPERFWTEAAVTGDFANSDAAITEAIKVGSWA